MGDVSDMMLDGTLCEGCGEFLNEHAPGYPCYCSDCKGERKAAKQLKYQTPRPKVKCSVCQKKVKPVGLPDHMKALHPDWKEYP